MSGTDLQKEWASSYLSGGSMAYVDGLYEDYLADPNSVPEDWRAAFDALPKLDGAAEEVSHRAIRDHFLEGADRRRAPAVAGADSKQFQVAHLINAYRSQGHHAAKLDPLDMAERTQVPSLELAYHHLSENDLDRPFFAGQYFNGGEMPLREILQALRDTYCGSIGIEYMHISDNAETEWLRQKMETARGRPQFDTKKN